MKAFRPAILSVSLGRAWLHKLDNKLQQAAQAGFEGVEIFYEGPEYLAKDISANDAPPTPENLLQAAQYIRQQCDSLNLTIIGLQPFLFYEGLLDRTQHARLITKMKLWFRIAAVLGTQTIQIPANFLPANQLTGDMSVITSDLRELADLGLLEEPVIGFAYENLCWSTYVDTWEKAWDVVCRVDRPNFGLCLDTFNIAGRVWGDPAAPTGRTRDADKALKCSLDAMLGTINVDKGFYIQVVDAERMEKPLVEDHPFHVDGNPPRMNWSRNARTFVYEEERGAYLPVEQVAETIIHGLGYKGFVSMELFSRTMAEEGGSVPREHAQRGAVAWKKFEQRLRLNQEQDAKGQVIISV